MNISSRRVIPGVSFPLQSKDPFRDTDPDDKKEQSFMHSSILSRPSFLKFSRTTISSLFLFSNVVVLGLPKSQAQAQEVQLQPQEEEGFESLAARAAQMAKVVPDNQTPSNANANTATLGSKPVMDARTMYDFSLPIAGTDVPLMDLIQQEFYENEMVVGEGGERKRDARVKAILVVNIKQDDPVARKNIPELISLAAKFGRSGDFAVICSPTDQGYFEADTSALIRLKLASEYGYGINPSTIITDKVNILGTGAHPFWRWIEGSCRAPSGLGRIQGNFEKFLVDGRTGKPLRRYPRQYQPFDIAEDIDAIIKGKPLPPAGANWREEWRSSDKDAEKDVYRFQKGLNFYDQ